MNKDKQERVVTLPLDDYKKLEEAYENKQLIGIYVGWMVDPWDVGREVYLKDKDLAETWGNLIEQERDRSFKSGRNLGKREAKENFKRIRIPFFGEIRYKYFRDTRYDY